MSEILSQEQIDALMSSGGQSDGGGEDLSFDSGGERAAKDYDALTRALGYVRDSAQSVVATLVNKKVSCELAGCKPAAEAQLASLFVEAPLSVNIPFAAGLPGVMHALIAKSATASLSDLMMMGDGSAQYTDDHKDALAEIFNQIMGSFGTAFGAAVHDSVSAGQNSVIDFDPSSPPIGLDTCDSAVLKLTVGELPEMTIALLVPDELSLALMAKMGAGGKGDGASVGLGGNELDDLSKVSGGFGEAQGGGEEPSFAGGRSAGGSIDMLLDIELDVSIELGNASLPIKRVLELAPGSIVELDRLAGEPVDLLVNSKVVAKGEVVVVDENFGIRIVSLVSPEERIKSLR